MNKKFKKFLKRTAICTTGFVAFAGAVVGGYVVTPNRSRIIDVTVQEREKTLFERFVAKISTFHDLMSLFAIISSNLSEFFLIRRFMREDVCFSLNFDDFD